MKLPLTIPVFPLPNVVLFPGVPLPLHIFEPRYRDMVADAMAGDELIGMALLRGDWQKTYAGTPEIFEVGCAGKIVSAEKLADGRFNILLQGVREYSITGERLERSYRQIDVIWRTPAAGLSEKCRSTLVQSLSEFLRALPESPAHRLLRDTSLSDESVVNFFSYALDIEPLEKQGLLQAETIEARAVRLIEILEFYLHEGRLNLRRSGAERCH